MPETKTGTSHQSDDDWNIERARPLRLMSVQAAADYARVSPLTIRRAIKSGRLKAYRAGRLIRIDEHDLASYLSPQTLEWV